MRAPNIEVDRCHRCGLPDDHNRNCMKPFFPGQPNKERDTMKFDRYTFDGVLQLDVYSDPVGHTEIRLLAAVGHVTADSLEKATTLVRAAELRAMATTAANRDLER